jgi:hypothetical protein
MQNVWLRNMPNENTVFVVMARFVEIFCATAATEIVASAL